jgi:hypothetical protein
MNIRPNAVLRRRAGEALDRTLSGEDPTAAFQFVNSVGPNEAAYVLTLPKRVQRDLYEARRLDNVARRAAVKSKRS